MIFRRFFGLFGSYYSLQYLSLSDATVLTFLSPMCTAIAGSFFLAEIFTYREAFAGRKWNLFQTDRPIQKCISRQSGWRGAYRAACRHLWFTKSSSYTHHSCNRWSGNYSYRCGGERNSRWKNDRCWVHFRTDFTKFKIQMLPRIALVGVLGASGACA